MNLWLIDLPSTDPAFGPLQRASELDPEEFGDLERGHRMAVLDAAWGAGTKALEVTARRMRRDAQSRSAEATAWGYELGITAVRVALRERHEAAEVTSCPPA